MKQCACIYVCVDDPAEMVSEQERRALRGYLCTECARMIPAGETYWHEAYRDPEDEKKTKAERTCLDCKSVRDVFFCDGWFWGQMWSQVQEHVEEMDGRIFCDGISDLTPRAQEMLFERVEGYWKEQEELRER